MNYKYIFILMLFSCLHAHTLLLNVYDNNDNTITVEGIFSTGELATGAEIRLESLLNKSVIYKKRLPQEGELVIKIPKEPYNVILYAGKGHEIVKKGLEPIDGYDTSLIKKKKSYSPPSNIKKDYSFNIILTSIIIAILLLSITMILSIRNTNKLMNHLKSK
ncbi:hypothetical protein OAR97_07465 [Arcobacteraceae bacterium]|nr:hypothetical protein [Arcobacteraceae bacterium]